MIIYRIQNLPQGILQPYFPNQDNAFLIINENNKKIVSSYDFLFGMYYMFIIDIFGKILLI